MRLFLVSGGVSAQEITDPINGGKDILKTVGIGEANIALAMDAEIRPADGGNACLFKQARGEFLGLPNPVCLILGKA